MKNILVAYDGGQPAHRALETGIELAKRFDASLAVVSVVPVRRGRSPIDPWDDTTVHDDQLAEARNILSYHGIARGSVSERLATHANATVVITH